MQIKEELEKLGYTVDVNLGKDEVTGSIPVISSRRRFRDGPLFSYKTY
jgi:hypothetical protein